MIRKYITSRSVALFIVGLAFVTSCGKSTNQKGGIQINTQPDATNIQLFRYVPRSATNTMPVYLKSAFNYLRPAVANPSTPTTPATTAPVAANTTAGASAPAAPAPTSSAPPDGEQPNGKAGTANLSYRKIFDPQTVTRKNNTVSLDGLGLISKVAGKNVAAYAKLQILTLINNTNYGTLSNNTFSAYYGKWNSDLPDYQAKVANGDEPAVVAALAKSGSCDTAPNTRAEHMAPLEWPANTPLPDAPITPVPPKGKRGNLQQQGLGLN
jgi:hypothetical protein